TYKKNQAANRFSFYRGRPKNLRQNAASVRRSSRLATPSITRWRQSYLKERALNRNYAEVEIDQSRSTQGTFVKRPFIRMTLVVILFVGALAIVIGDLVHRTRGRKLRETILAELQPVVLKNCTFKRFGSANDGGYVMCENLIEPLQAAYSYG